MNIKKENLGKNKIKLTISLEPRELAGYFRKSFDRLSKEVKLDGFREGKAPYKLVEAKIGHNRLLGDGVDMAANESFRVAIEQEKLMPLSPPKVEIKKIPGYSLDETEIADDLIFEAEFEIMPEIKLGDYKKIKVKVPEKRKSDESDVEKILLHLRRQKATFKEIERGAKTGDRIEINYEGTLKGVKLDKLYSKNHPLILGEGNLIPGFEDQISGLKMGESKEFEITFPKDYHDKDVADKKVKFKVTLADAKEVVLPECNNVFAKEFGQETVAKLEKSIAKSLEQEIEVEHKNMIDNMVVEKVLPLLTIDVPEILVWQESERMLETFKNQIESRGMNFEKYLTNMKKDIETIKNEMKPQAEKNVKIGLMLGKVIEAENIDPKDKEAGRRALEKLVEIATGK
ncbi:trigger factor [Candidatus Berkelbacteria bacterium RIFOXYA2_FULL_43_10]|uniref:Trigger factor n=1 Tax=Candidatus Berkelbacteria bacterium RIFOXYA2_FULL_43_10 TaxID=1797472 RepID=A0A1F5E4Y4_9BACT|nr:MAG: trigger factor [Candidatus Berkelbacteria bacterium RIFOXYA2_FULL_43_10]